MAEDLERLEYDLRLAAGGLLVHGMDADAIGQAISALRASTAREKALREALEFYAREYNWRSHTVYMCGHAGDSSSVLDGGKRARAALERGSP